MDPGKLKTRRRLRRKRHVRKKVFGTADRPRLSVSRSLKNIWVQVIDDECGRTLCQAGTRNKEVASELPYGGNRDAASRIGALIAERAKSAGITRVVFDRNGYPYHGRVKSLGDAAREGGLEF